MLLSRRLIHLTGLVILLALVLSCGSAHTSDEYYVFVAANVQVPYWKAAAAGLSNGASALKVRSDFDGPPSYDAKAERDALDQAVQKKATGILLAVTDPAVLKDSIDKAVAAGIPVITIDSDAPASKRLFFIGTNNYQAGLIGGQRLVNELHGKGNVVVFTMPEQANLNERLRGYRDALEGHAQIKITQTVDMKGDPRVAFDAAEQILGKGKDQVNAFVCLEALAGKEVATVLNNNKIKDKVIMVMDTDPDTLEWIQKGVIAATISQKPYTMASFGLRMLDNLYHNKLGSLDEDWSKDSFAPVPAFVDTGSSLVDKNNVEAFMAANKSKTAASHP